MLTVTKEPQVARFTSDNAIVKDHYYYQGNGFSWERPARVHKKFYPYYHQQQYEHKPKIEEMKQKEVEDKKLYQEVRIEKLIEKKIHTQDFFNSKIKEREIMQRMSSQPIVNSRLGLDVSEEDRKGMFEIVAKRLNSGMSIRSDEFSWNKLNLASKKNVDIYLGAYSVSGEEEMIRKYKQKVDKEITEDEEQQKKRTDFHTKTRMIFLNKHEENLVKEASIGRPATAKSSFFNTPRVRTPNGQMPILNLKANTNSNNYIRDYGAASNLLSNSDHLTDKILKPITSPSIERLSVAKDIIKKEFNIDQPDIKGMLVQNMDQKIYYPGNNFYDALKSKSNVFSNILDENQAKKRIASAKPVSQLRISTGASNKTPTTRPLTTSSSKFILRSHPDVILKPYSATPGARKGLNGNLLNRTTDSNAKYNMDSKEVAFQEIDTFESQFCRGGKKVGYARVNLEEAYKLTSAGGLPAMQQIEAKKKEPLIKD